MKRTSPKSSESGPRITIVQDYIPVPDPDFPDEGPDYYTRDLKLHCWLCDQDRLVIDTFISQPQFDATEAYRLICGHTTI